MVMQGAAFEPEVITLMKSALDGAATLLPQNRRTASTRVKMASRILAAVAKGERNPAQLIIAALLEGVDE
jgi:hypothetical protein